MKAFPLSSGYEIPALGLGTWKLAREASHQAIKEALRAGYRHIDCAWVYDNEKEIGAALKEAMEEGAVSREELFVTSKLWNDSHAPKDVRPALERTLKDLQLEYLDLYLIHWPVALQKGHSFPPRLDQCIPLEECPIEATWAELEKAVDDGLVRSIGVSNFSTRKLADLLAKARIPPAVNQVECHPYLQQDTLSAYCAAHNVHITSYSPLGGPGAANLLDSAVIRSIAARHGATPAQVALAWNVTERGHSAVCKSARAGRLQENLAALQAVRLREEDLAQLRALDCGQRQVSGDFLCAEGGPYTLATLWDGET